MNNPAWWIQDWYTLNLAWYGSYCSMLPVPWWIPKVTCRTELAELAFKETLVSRSLILNVTS